MVTDFGGVLTLPLMDVFARVQDDLGVSGEDFGRATRRALERDGVHPLFELETGRISEAQFLARLEDALADVLGRRIALHGFAGYCFDAMRPNHELFDYYRALRERGLRLAILTNNVREWEPLWRALLPVDALFELVVDSAFVGMRKPDPEIYALTLERLGLPADACAFVDDLEPNVAAARALGLHGVHFRDTAQAIGELEVLLA